MPTPKKKTTTKTATSKKLIKVSIPEVTESNRKRKTPKYKSFRLSKKIPHPDGPLPSSRIILQKTLKLIRKNVKPLLGVLVVYIILNLVLVRGFSSPLNITDLKDSIKSSFGTSVSNVSLVGAVFGNLVTSSNNTSSDAASVYQTMLFVIISLALIWIYRQSAIGIKPTAKKALYNGMYPLIPFLLVVVVLIIQLIPAYIGSFIYGAVSSGGLAVTGFEKGLWLFFLASLLLLSVYMVCSSLFALYIVTLPDMSPMRALRSSRQLVFSRRLNVFRKFLLLPLIAILILILLVVPAIYFLPNAAPWLYFVISLGMIIFVHAYLFTLYKELL